MAAVTGIEFLPDINNNVIKIRYNYAAEGKIDVYDENGFKYESKIIHSIALSEGVVGDDSKREIDISTDDLDIEKIEGLWVFEIYEDDDKENTRTHAVFNPVVYYEKAIEELLCNNDICDITTKIKSVEYLLKAGFVQEAVKIAKELRSKYYKSLDYAGALGLVSDEINTLIL